MKNTFVLSAVAAMVLAGCSTQAPLRGPDVQDYPVVQQPQVETYPIPDRVPFELTPLPDDGSYGLQFDTNEVRWSLGTGDNEIRGKAAIDLIDGNSVSCAGLPVYVIPVSRYSADRMIRLYGNTETGELVGTAPPASAGYVSTVRSNRCNDAGIFQITEIPSGEYYVTSTMSGFGVDDVNLMQRVTLPGAETATIIFSPY